MLKFNKGVWVIEKILVPLLYVLLFIHFSIVGLSLLPNNPISHVHKSQIRSYVDPFFTQNWNLFAPNPIASNQTLLIEFTTHYKKDSVTSKWLDIKDAVHKTRVKNFWSPLQRLEKYIGSITESIVEDQIELKEYLTKHPNISKDSITILLNQYKTNYGHRTLIKYSKIVYSRIHAIDSIPNADSVCLKYRIVDAEFPRFSKRYLDYYDLKNYKVTYHEFDLNKVF
jgi:Family of unknown function (DUF5819)